MFDAGLEWLTPVQEVTAGNSIAQRERVLDALRNEGDFLYNVDILKNGDENGFGLIVAKRPEAGEHIVKDYLPCTYCLRFYVKTELWRHGQRCQLYPRGSYAPTPGQYTCILP